MRDFELQPKFWLGSEESYAAYEAAIKKAPPTDEAKDTYEDMYSNEDGVGVINIRGHLVNGSTGPFFRSFGIVGYGDIAEAVKLAAADKNAKTVLLNMTSPGGSVAGIQNASTLLNALATVKPMTGYTELAASAGFWLFSNAAHRFASPEAMTGSVGVIRIHHHIHDDQVTTTVLREGEYKALGNLYEPLSELARAEIQGQLRFFYDVFVKAIADNLGTTTTVVDTVMGRGREFIGRQGVDVGTVNAIGSYGEALAYAKSNTKTRAYSFNFAPSVTSAVAGTENAGYDAGIKGTNPMPNPLTPEQIAALASGADLGIEPAPVAAVEPEKTPEAQEPQSQESTPEAEASDVVTFLKTELAAAQLALAQATTQAAAAASQVAELQEVNTSLLPIVQAATQNLAVALNKPVDTAKMDAKELASAHAELSAAFKVAYKPGVSSASTASIEPAKSKVDPLFMARINTLKK